MRLFAGNTEGLNKFRDSELLFLGENDLHKDFPKSLFIIRREIIKECWEFINQTEFDSNLVGEFDLNDFLKIFEAGGDKYKLMNQFYNFEFKVPVELWRIYLSFTQKKIKKVLMS